MAKTASRRSHLSILTPLAHESLYVGVDIGKHSHVAGFVSTTLLTRHERFEGMSRPSLQSSTTQRCIGPIGKESTNR